MNQWEIYTFEFAPEGSHPAVLVSNSDRAARKQVVNVLFCSSQRVTREAKPTEVLLDDADGLDWLTACRCDVMYSVDKARLGKKRGVVSPHRRRAIVEKIVASYRFNQV